MSDADCFFDTSVLIYLLSSEPEKADRVESLLANPGTISVQVLNEFTSVATRKFGMSLADVREILDTVRTLCQTESLPVEDYDRAVAIMGRYKFSLYDSVIIASALNCNCRILYSEDLQHGQVIDSQLKIIDPFIS